ncbi:MAG: sigma-E factor negative regulatory protein [Pseudomonadales bacterium]|nr:sigma-E factor negative regulatory protein [Pseudomonadales bacterium]
MSERSHEELSALMDGEASDLELRRTLKSLESDSELIQKWRRYHVSRSVMHGDLKAGHDARFAKVDLTASIAAAIDKEAAHDVAIESKPSWASKVLQPLSSVAVAASVSAMVVFGWQTFQQQGGAVNAPHVAANSTTAPVATLVAANGTVNQVTNSAKQAITIERPANAYVTTVAESRLPAQSKAVAQPEIVRMPIDKNQRLNHYLVSHSGNAALNTVSGSMSYTRVVHIAP